MFKIYSTDIARIESVEDQLLQVSKKWQKFQTTKDFPYQVEAIEFCDDLVVRFRDHRDEIVFSFVVKHK